MLGGGLVVPGNHGEGGETIHSIIKKHQQQLSPAPNGVGTSDKDDVFSTSMLRMEEELLNLQIHSGQRSSPLVEPLTPETLLKQVDVSPVTPEDVEVGYRHSGQQQINWFEGIIGCLRPVWTIIGKSALLEKQAQCDDHWEIPFEELSDLQWLGSGAQGAVFRGNRSGELVAIKKVRELKETDISHLRKLNHSNIVTFKGVCTVAPCYCIVMEYCPYGPLYNLLKDGRDIPPERLAGWAKQIASGMSYLHSHKIIHRDLKSPNVLIAANETVKISDFGTCREWNDVSTRMSFAGTLAWMAPEVIRNEPCNEKVDIWSFGVVLWELLTCEIPYREVDNSAIIYGVGSNALHLPIPSTCPDGYRLIVQMCWNAKPRNRPSFKYILMHLDIAAVEILSTPPETYAQKQASWKAEIRQYMANTTSRVSHVPHIEEEDLVKRRHEELKHAQDIREHWERKLVIANDLYLELSAAMLQLEQREKDLIKRESCGENVTRKKRIVRPLIKAQERLQKCRRSTIGNGNILSVVDDTLAQSEYLKKSLYIEMGNNNNPRSTISPSALMAGKYLTKDSTSCVSNKNCGQSLVLGNEKTHLRRRGAHQRTRSHGGVVAYVSAAMSIPTGTSETTTIGEERCPVLVESGTQTDNLECNMSEITVQNKCLIYKPSTLNSNSGSMSRICSHSELEKSPNGNTITQQSPCCEHCPRQKYQRYISSDSNASFTNSGDSDSLLARLTSDCKTPKFTIEETLKILNNNDLDTFQENELSIDILHQLSDKWDAIENVLSDKKALPSGYESAVKRVSKGLENTTKDLLAAHKKQYDKTKVCSVSKQKIDSQSQKSNINSIHEDLINSNFEFVAPSAELESSQDSTNFSAAESDNEDTGLSLNTEVEQSKLKRKCFSRKPVSRNKNGLYISDHGAGSQSSEDGISEDLESCIKMKRTDMLHNGNISQDNNNILGKLEPSLGRCYTN